MITTIHTNGGVYAVNETMQQARIKFRRAVSSDAPLVGFTLSNGADFDIATKHIIGIEGLESTAALVEKYGPR